MKKDLGQLIITGLSGTQLLSEEAKFLESENIGGVVLNECNFESPAQLAELINNIQKCREEYPLFIAVDHEGGRNSSFGAPFSKLPPALDLVLLDSPKIIYHVTKIMADELSAVGVNLNLAPVCDILESEESKLIGDRAYGRDPETVSKYISSVIRGLQTNGVMSCAKHFPGHGGTQKDSNVDLPIIKKSLAELRGHEFIPFVKAIKSRVEFVMMGHLVVEGIDPERPCSLSDKAYQLIRSEMKYNKIICTDEMRMGAIANKYSPEEAAVMAVNAGADVLVYRELEAAQVALEALQEAVKIKKIKNETVQSHLFMVMNTKKSNLKQYNPVYIPEISKKINQRASQVFLEELESKIKAAKKELA